MSKVDKKKIEDLKKEIQKHDYLYYALDDPQISDYKYDQLFKELETLEKKHPQWVTSDSPTQRVSGQALDHFSKVTRQKPMLSLDNTYSTDELDEFLKKVLKNLNQKKLLFFCEPKLDGVGIELVYKKGQLVHALTRGDGKTGEDVLFNVKTIKSVPLKLKTSLSLLEIRSEVVLFKKDFERINKNQAKEGQKIYANPRNVAAGTLRNLVPEITASRKLRLFCHSPGVIEGVQITTQHSFYDLLQKYKLPCFSYSKTLPEKKAQLSNPLCFSTHRLDDIVLYYKRLQELRPLLPFEIDGVVVKVDSFDVQEELGFTGRSPKWATAVKFPPENAQTKVEEIIVQTGRTGVIVPVARMKPVLVGNVTVSHATLHNFNELQRKDVRVGDVVIIERSGDVIPEIKNVIKEKRSQNSVPFKIPKKCPSCLKSLVKVEDSLYCSNENCFGIRLRKLQHFCSKKAMNVESLGDQIIENLFNKKWIQSFSDIYKLEKEKLETLEGFGPLLSKNIEESIHRSKKTTLPRFLFALGIRHIGENTALKLEEFFGGGKEGLKNLFKASKDELLQVEDVGEAVALSLIEGLKNLKPEIDLLLKKGIILKSEKKKSSKLRGLTFVITGSFKLKRKEIELLIRDHGGKVSSNVSQKTQYVVVGKTPGSKQEKARKLKVPCLTFNELKKLFS